MFDSAGTTDTYAYHTAYYLPGNEIKNVPHPGAETGVGNRNRESMNYVSRVGRHGNKRRSEAEVDKP